MTEAMMKVFPARLAADEVPVGTAILAVAKTLHYGPWLNELSKSFLESLTSGTMMRSRTIRHAVASLGSLILISSANAVVIPTYFGWNLDYSLLGKPRAVSQLIEIRYIGESNLGLVPDLDTSGIYVTPPLTVTMPNFPGFDVGFGTGRVFPPESGSFQFQGIPDVEDENPVGIGPPLTTSFTFSRGGNGETTRTFGAPVAIDWVPAGTPTPWGTLPFPSIIIISIQTVLYGYYDPFGEQPNDFIRTPDATPDLATIFFEKFGYVLGLIPSGPNTELSSNLTTPQGDIYGNPTVIFLGNNEISTAFSASVFSLRVAIDIKPDSFPNVVNPKSEGVVAVAILTTNDFDATTVDPLSVKFGPNEAVEALNAGHTEDVNGDGRLDLVLYFNVQDTGITCGDTVVVLTGTTLDGQPFSGFDSIQTVGCKSKSSEAK
jgi:hypothetical protein